MTHSSASLATSPTLDALLSQSLHAVERSAACCCGQEQCAYLESNNAAMQGLEKNLQSAAQVGQVCTGLILLLITSILQVHGENEGAYLYGLFLKHVADICTPGTTQ